MLGLHPPGAQDSRAGGSGTSTIGNTLGEVAWKVLFSPKVGC